MNAEPTLGMRIRQALERRRWSQQELAAALGVSLRTVNDWVNDRAVPRASIGAIEDILGIRLRQAGPDPVVIAAENLRRMLAAHPPEVLMYDDWIERLVAEYVRLLRAGGEAAS